MEKLRKISKLVQILGTGTLLLCLSACVSKPKQNVPVQNNSFGGLIVSDDGEKISGFEVEIKYGNGFKKTKKVVTNAGGIFYLSQVEIGNIQVSGKMPGYEILLDTVNYNSKSKDKIFVWRLKSAMSILAEVENFINQEYYSECIPLLENLYFLPDSSEFRTNQMLLEMLKKKVREDNDNVED